MVQKERCRKSYCLYPGRFEIGQLSSLKIRVVPTIVNMKKISGHDEAPATRREHSVSQPRAPQGCMLAMRLPYLQSIKVKTRMGETINSFSPAKAARRWPDTVHSWWTLAVGISIGS